MTIQKILRQVSGDGAQQHRPHADRAASWSSCPTCRRSSLELGDAVRPDRRHADRASTSCRQIGAGVWVEFEQGDPDYPIWVGCYWGTAAEVPPPCLDGPPGDRRTSSLQTALQNASVISDLPRADGRHHAQERDRRDHHRQRHRHLHPERQGRIIIMTGPTVTINQRCDGRHLSRRPNDAGLLCPPGRDGPLLARSARRPRPRQPARLGRGQPVATSRREPTSVAGCAFTGSAGHKPQPCVTAQWVTGRPA